MQLTITINLSEKCSLPLAYHHILQAVIYRLMAEDGNESTIHDKGAENGKRVYKLFTFGLIKGHYQINNKRIIFDDTMSFEVRCLEEKLLLNMQKNILSAGINLCGSTYTDVTCTLRNTTIKEDKILIRMDSPICVYSTIEESGFTKYYSPEDTEFATLVNENFKRKYAAATNQIPDGDITIEPYRVGSRDKYVTTYKDTYLSGWKGYYSLSGKAEYLTFLYNTGLGSKNSQGFGLFTCQ